MIGRRRQTTKRGRPSAERNLFGDRGTFDRWNSGGDWLFVLTQRQTNRVAKGLSRWQFARPKTYRRRLDRTHGPVAELVQKSCRHTTRLFLGIPPALIGDRDGHGVELHALCNTLITNLPQSGVTTNPAPFSARHSDITLTMNVYFRSPCPASSEARVSCWSSMFRLATTPRFGNSRTVVVTRRALASAPPATLRRRAAWPRIVDCCAANRLPCTPFARRRQTLVQVCGQPPASAQGLTSFPPRRA